MNHVESISNGLGAQSIWLLVMAIRGKIPATVSITADTGWEEDCVWNNGRRTAAHTYYHEVVVPLCKGSRVTPYFVRANLRDKETRMVSLHAHTLACAEAGMLNNIKIPVFGSRGGRMKQSCTQRWKVSAINQLLRKLGAKTARTAQGIHFGEADRRVKGKFTGVHGGWSIYQSTIRRNKIDIPIKWLSHYYPLVDLKLRREDIVELVKAEGIPYLHSSECDLCPHKDLARWERTSEETLDQGERLEEAMGGQFFLTDRRIPLRLAIAAMQADRAANPKGYAMEVDFGCRNDLCGV